ncbi:MAG TPA: hypothetical protein EYN03_05735 [Planctomycetes bacterium]|nr:hypothetical protein [Planctomycetaceae bacterium]HIN95127.1 hypothetical protein [Planctomycetota bacterium]
MSELLLHYEKVNPTTWVYLSSLLIIGLYFKFNRFWSVRNLDIVLLILFAPGLVLVHLGQQDQLTARSLSEKLETAVTVSNSEPGLVAVPSLTSAGNNSSPETSVSALEQQQEVTDRLVDAEHLQRLGFIWLMVIGGLFLLRLLLDPTMVRRPLLESNLSLGGLTFLGLSMFVFLIANVMIAGHVPGEGTSPARSGILSGEQLLADPTGGLHQGPGYSLLENVPSVPIMPWRADDIPQLNPVDYRFSRLLVILSHLAIVLGMVAIGYWHFENIKTGIGAATLYLILPYTAQMGGRVDHAFPAAMLIWAIVFYRRPLISGTILGFSACIYYPLFLLPLWMSFYAQRGLLRFLSGVGTSLAVLVLLLFFSTSTEQQFVADLRRMFGLMMPRMDDLQGIWMLGWDPAFRLPVMTAFFALAATLALWPAQKNLGTLMSCSAAILVATRFWNGNGGGLYMGWYLPLILVTVFRPNLEDRVAITVLEQGWSRNRRSSITTE